MRSSVILCVVAAAMCFAASAQSTSPYYHKFTNLQKNTWGPGYALLAPTWSICKSCSSTSNSVNWSRTKDVLSPSLSGGSAKHAIGGTHPYADFLWNDHLVGSFTTQ